MDEKVPNLYKLNEILWSAFRDIYFEDEGHRYTDSEGNVYKSVSTVIEEHHDEFKEKEVAPHTAAKMTRELKRVVTPKEVLDMWHDKNNYGKDIGHAVHNVMENLWARKSYYHKFKKRYKYDDIQADFDRRIPKCKTLFSKLSERYVPIRTELPVYDKKHLICGTMDILLYDKQTEKLVIGDWKTNSHLDFEPKYYTTPMYSPFENFYDINYHHYCIQLSMYKAILELNTPLKVGAMWICHIPAEGEAKPYGIIDVSDVIKRTILA